MKRNPIPTADDICEVCGKPYAELHEVFEGPNRQHSIEHGLQIRLCAEHHRGKNGPHMNAKTEQLLKRAYQYKFEVKKMEEGLDPDQARDAFMAIFGRNYIDL